ncbi:ABC transporter protein YOR1 [Zymoseptoria brevis]|uniref:ABC transporter protein YOR1 n=1 Tax=Zymoseptoria brevis TaxID=1047168 RepID=A0A0F4GRG8_9PEZI|nr:ABC transporter protein YOR1 [Zymoseptoria brevis]
MSKPPLAYPPRKWYRRVPFLSDKSSLTLLDSNGNRKVTPEASANLWNWFFFSWLNPLIAIGYSRPHIQSELYLLPPSSDVCVYAGKLDGHIERLRERVPEGGGKRWKLNFHSPSWRLARALNASVLVWFWVGGAIKLFADVATITSPLLVRAMIRFLQTSEQNRKSGLPEPSIGEGFGMAIGLALLLASGVMANVHGFYRSYTTGILLRSALIDSLFRRTSAFSPLERASHNLGTSRIISMISTDVSRIDFASGYFHATWTSIIQILICLGLSIASLGPSALTGFGLMAILVPSQNYIVKYLFLLRKRSMPFTDARLSAISEALSSIRLVKVYAWESALLAKISSLRRSELKLLRSRLLLRAVNIALSFSVPTLAAVVSFVTYAALGNELDAAEVFSALTLFMLLRTPLLLLPVAFGAAADGANAIQRLSGAFDAPMAEHGLLVDEDMEAAVELKEATFSYRVQDHSDEKSEKKPAFSFQLTNLTLTINRGELFMIVGPVGAGKSTLLGSLVGETRMESGQAVLGSRAAYAPQQAWLKSGSIRENIVFGRPWNAARYNSVLSACCLTQDLSTFPSGDETMIGEKGISLSGGQRQRVALARTIYSPSPLLLLDDVFSALDAHVQAEVVQKVILERDPRTTLVLVTHSLHLLRHADRICCLADGRVEEMGTFAELMGKEEGKMRRVLEEFARKSSGGKEEGGVEDGDLKEGLPPTDGGDVSHTTSKSSASTDQVPPTSKAMMQTEERFVGSVTARTYASYVRAGKPAFTLTSFIISMLIFQGGSILSPLWLQWWQEGRFTTLSSETYMGVYAALGVSQAIGLLAMSSIFGFFIFYSACQIHAGAIRSVLYAPISFFDTTPLGRITHRFSKDIDAIDNVIGEAFRMLLSTVAQVVGAVVLISIILPWFLLAVFVIVILYILTGMYYRPTARELRRLDALTRSPVYEHVSESLNGIMVIRSLGALQTTLDRNRENLNTENSPYWLSVACQRWLSVRLDLLGTCLVLLVGLIVVGSRSSISAAQGGVALSYIVTVQAVFGFMIRQSAEIENNMNAIERLLYYSHDIPQEPPHKREGDVGLVEKKWPGQGAIEMRNLVFTHREGLEPSLRGVNLVVPAGCRLALVGRTGSGKSTMLAALVGMGEITEGTIMVDGVDVSTIGLNLLRKKIAFMPQEAAVVGGTLRYNLDPFGEHDDADLWRVMHQVGLSSISAQSSAETLASTDAAANEKEKKSSSDDAAISPSSPSHQSQHLTLDTPIHAERSDLSSGQRSLISLARALIKDASIFVLDEATASMDMELDHRLQRVLRENLRGKTTIVIAHRLDSVVGSSDLICVMDEGRVAQCGSPMDLFGEEGGHFRSLCSDAGLGELDIVEARRRFVGS